MFQENDGSVTGEIQEEAGRAEIGRRNKGVSEYLKQDLNALFIPDVCLDYCLAGTALLGLERLSRDYQEFDHWIGQKAVDWGKPETGQGTDPSGALSHVEGLGVRIRGDR